MNKVLLTVQAHPDDESYATGGTLARYAAEGTDVHIVIATDGAAGSIDSRWQGDRSKLAESRAAELRRAVDVLGGHLHMLGYRDSGYINDPANEHPDAFINSDEHEVIGKVVALIRQLKPQVIITHDEKGGYFHPDHIFCHKIASAAFFAAGDPKQYPELGFEPHEPERLYFSAFSNRWARMFSLIMRFRGQDPTKAGRNKDIDFTQMGMPPSRLTTTISYRKYYDAKIRASAEHGSQGGGTSFSRLFPMWIQKLLFARETFVRAHPPVPAGFKEKDLFPA
jgi:LmbE family N-acetylglucosaminyl deacetylase